MRGAALVGGCCVALSLAGCADATAPDRTGPAGDAAGEPTFSPCDDIPDEVLRGMGLDPATEERDIVGVPQPGFHICDWRGRGYSVGVFATVRSMDDVRRSDRNEEFQPVVVGSREAMTYREVADADRRRCDVAVSTGDGVVLINVMYPGVDPVLEEPCTVAVRTANQLERFLPN